MTRNKEHERQDPYARIWEAILKQQRKSRFLAEAAGFENAVNFPEALLLLIVDEKPDQSIGEIAAQLTLERSWVSRLVTSLEERGLLSSAGSEGDQRVRNVRITKKGLSVLEQVLKARSGVLEQVYRGLNQDEQDELVKLLRKLADGMGAPNLTIQLPMHPIDTQLARFSWRAGIMNDNVMDSGASVTKYQVLFALARHKDELVSPSDLGKLFPVNLSSVSRLVASLERQGVIKRTKSAKDGRVSLLQISQKGLALCQDLRQKAAGKISEAMRGVPVSEVKRISELIFKATSDYVGKLSHHPRSSTDIRSIQPGEVHTFVAAAPKDKQAALRDVEKMAESGEGKLFGYFKQGSLTSLLRVNKESKEQGFKEVFFWGADLEEPDMIRFLRVSLQAARSKLVDAGGDR